MMSKLVAKLARRKTVGYQRKFYIVSAMVHWAPDTTIWATEEDADRHVATLLASASDLELQAVADPELCLREWRSPHGADFVRLTEMSC